MILHVIPDSDDPQALVAKVMDAVPSVSCLALSHLGSDLLDQEARQGFDNIVRRSAQQQYRDRSRAEMLQFFTGLDLVEPGLVRVEQWNPDPDPAETGRSTLWCAVAREL